MVIVDMVLYETVLNLRRCLNKQPPNPLKSSHIMFLETSLILHHWLSSPLTKRA